MLNNFKLFIKKFPWLIPAIVAVILFTLPLNLKNPYILNLGITIFLFTVWAIPVYQMAVVNRLLFGPAAFIGIGAYTSTLLVINQGVPYLATMFIGGIFAAIFALIIGIPILRISGVYFAIITWSLGEVLVAVYKGVSIFGGVIGIDYIPPASMFGVTFTGNTHYYYLSLVMVCITILFFYRLSKSRFGHDLKAIGLSDGLAEVLGIDVTKYRLISFVIAAFFLGLGGAFYAPYTTVLFPYFFGLDLSSKVFAFSVVGGFGNVWGGLVGSIIMTMIPEWFDFVEYWKPVTYGGFIIFTMIFMPGGLISLPRQVRLWRKGEIREDVKT